MRQLLPLLILTISLWACSQKPEPITFGRDQCAYCKMTIANPKFGAEMITKKGRIYKFDAAECLIDYLHENTSKPSKKLAIAYDDPKKLYPVDSLHFVISSEYRSPMGENLAAFKTKSNAKINHPQFMTWQQVADKLETSR